MRTIVKHFSNPRLILVLGILLMIDLVLFSIPSLAGSQSQILAAAPDFTLPDIKGIYTPAYVYEFLAAIGPAGRHAYQMMHFTTDLALPLLYGLLLFAGICRLVSLQPGININLPLVALLPMTSDLAENFCMVTITAKYPEVHTGLTWLAQGFTLLKFSGFAICLAVIIFSIARHRKVKH